MKALGSGDLRKVGQIDKQTGWSIQSTTGVLPFCNEVAGLPVRNFRKTHHPEAWKVDGERCNNARVATYGCPTCTMRCGITIHDDEGRESELDYENVALLGPNLEIFDLPQVGALNYLCDDYGLDTMSAGCVLSFYADAIEHGATQGDFRFGDAKRAKELLGLAAQREGPLGNLLADGSLRMARAFGHGSEAYAMQVKGLEVAAYNCKFIPGQALSFGVAPIGAHHREAWIITFEIKHTTRESYGPEKAAKIIELQRIRGGLFEMLVACRFPWIENGWPLEHYPKYFNTVTGLNWGLDDMWKVADRIYAMIKLHYLRQFPGRRPARTTIPRPSGSIPPTPIPKARSPARSWRSTSTTACSSITTTSAATTGAASRPRPPSFHSGWPRKRRPWSPSPRSPDRRETAMKIQVKIIGPLIYTTGFSEKEIEVEAGMTVDGLTAILGLPQERPRIITRNGTAIAPDEALAEGDKIAVSPIYSGG